MRGLKKWMAGAFAAVMAQSVLAGYTWNFPEPVTPIARETLHVHNLFMIIILIIFFGVFGLDALFILGASQVARSQSIEFYGPTFDQAVDVCVGTFCCAVSH